MAPWTRHQRWHQLVVRTSCTLGVTLLIAGCAAAANPDVGGGGAPGFWLGLWQGFIAPIAFLVSLFDHSVGIYEVHNNGVWYDLGFLIGISAFFSGSAGAHRQTRPARRSSSSQQGKELS